MRSVLKLPQGTHVRVAPHLDPEAHPASRSPVFLRLAWVANPFAYIAINTILALMPGIAARLELSTMNAGFVGSVWFFARMVSFVVLWGWMGWHYRFNWLAGSFVALIAAFSLIVLVPNLAVVVLAQLAFGTAAGLIYYSSLFYSMDLGDTKGEHGGFHEAAIGVGNLCGPAVGAASMHFFPTHPASGPGAVTLLLIGGLATVITIWRRRGPSAVIPPKQNPPTHAQVPRRVL
jgi:MFS family permease